MNQEMKRAALLPSIHIDDTRRTPITQTMSSRLIVLAGALKRAAALRYKRVAGLSEVEFVLVASLGHESPMSVVKLAETVGLDKGQISRVLTRMVARHLASRSVNPDDSREVLISLTDAGMVTYGMIVTGAQERNRRLLADFREDEVAMLQGYVDRLTTTAAQMLDAEKSIAESSPDRPGK
jgi:DNA-binding MarR family transcriptional regulator